MSTVAEKVIELIEASQSAFAGADTLSLKNRFLFALKEKSLSPKEIGDRLRQDKTNVAHLAAAAMNDGLVEKSVLFADKRRVRYRLSPAGRDKVGRILSAAEARFTNFLNTPEQLSDAEDKLDELIRLFSFL